MKYKLIFIIFILCSCNKQKISGYVYDYDTNRPIRNVQININNVKTQTDSIGYFNIKINSNSECILVLRREGYAAKKLYRNSKIVDMAYKKRKKNDVIYLYKKDSDFSQHSR